MIALETIDKTSDFIKEIDSVKQQLIEKTLENQFESYKILYILYIFLYIYTSI